MVFYIKWKFSLFAQIDKEQAGFENDHNKIAHMAKPVRYLTSD